MVDEKTAHLILRNIRKLLEALTKRFRMNRTMHATSLIEKLSLSWGEYKNYIRDMSLADLIVHISVE